MNTELGGTDQFPLDFEVGVAPYPNNEGSDNNGFTPVTTDYMAVALKNLNRKKRPIHLFGGIRRKGKSFKAKIYHLGMGSMKLSLQISWTLF